MMWIAKFNLDEFMSGNAWLLVQNYSARVGAVGGGTLDDRVTDIKE